MKKIQFVKQMLREKIVSMFTSLPIYNYFCTKKVDNN